MKETVHTSEKKNDDANDDDGTTTDNMNNIRNKKNTDTYMYTNRGASANKGPCLGEFYCLHCPAVADEEGHA